MQNLKSLISNLPIQSVSGEVDINVTGIAYDSRSVKLGNVFVAINGINNDGHNYISKAIELGCLVVVGEKKLNLSGVTYIEVKDSREALGIIASNWYGNPSSRLTMIGVTGTDGKTTTSNLIFHILNSQKQKTGIISTVSAKIGSVEHDTGFHVTNPDPISTNKFLKEMVDSGCKYAVVEVTSHGIDQKRIAGLKFDICVITNITHEHLDYHKTFENYRAVKLSFLNLAKKYVVLNKDDSAYQFLKTHIKQKIFEYERTLDVTGILPGLYNESNASAAVKVAEILGFSRKKALASVKNFEFPVGRLQRIKNSKGIDIYVDFAHTPNALENVLAFLKKDTKGKLIAVFGSAGERDAGKRPLMGLASSKYADTIVLTAEDPRTESIKDIIKQIQSGIVNFGGEIYGIEDRKKAIEFALQKAQIGDTVGIFGKGHEKSMNMDGIHETPWSDQEVVRKYLERSKI